MGLQAPALGARLGFYSHRRSAGAAVDVIDYVFDGEAGLRYHLNDWARLSLLAELNQLRGRYHGVRSALPDRFWAWGW